MTIEDIPKQFEENGYKQSVQYASKKFDHVYQKDNRLFYLKFFSKREELEAWQEYQSEINNRAFSIAPDLIRYNIYFVLLLGFPLTDSNHLLIVRIENDRYFCRKIILSDKTLEFDALKLPFVGIPENVLPITDISAKALSEFLAEIEGNPNHQALVRNIFGKQPEEMFDLIIKYFGVKKS